MRDALGPDHARLRALELREFFTHLAWLHPPAFERLEPRTPGTAETARLRAWCAGRTGLPVVDAAMRQLASSGFINDRLRRLVARVLIQALGVDWRLGERHFARHLVDYEPCLSLGNWRSTLTGRAPIEAWTWQRAFDPEARYVREWVPELAALDADAIHRLDQAPRPQLDYPPPIVDLSARWDVGRLGAGPDGPTVWG
jgi:deoxyribodipyrimidine photo-lyase